MGKFAITTFPGIEMKSGDTEKIEINVLGFDLTGWTVKFKAINATGNIIKQTGSGITTTAYTNNAQTVTIAISPTETKSLTGDLKYEIQIEKDDEINTIAQGKIIISPEIIL